jgi:hypothetical protein
MDMTPGAYGDDPPPTSVAYATVEHIGEHVPHTYLGVLLASGSSGYDAVDALEKRALETARREHAQITDLGRPGHGRFIYALVGMRITAGMSSSGQPEWLAYGTLLQMRRVPRSDEAHEA